MHFKLIIALVDEGQTKHILQAARESGATGATVIGSARGEGLSPKKTFFGLNLESQRDMLMFIVEEHLGREVLEHIATIGGFDENPGSGLAFQLDVEDAIGLASQIKALSDDVEDVL
ncbi:MAG: transcriptional regulator [Zetaproteobacteria bacterium CG12_big_fil_rev_8_21_14_0_65_54_13]|nr:MAG: transcriptional regulator [Zetaproteobacteria bacterium CG12_big_fil_rev_8_21_14_0_65_54_13]PIX54054.1 MAG: transcriptional regulator [Zetaproteobacteria bacterium CG_4_10_14_3_um_filter_54_28]PJA28910.1 MAG: transcriptional regulator [Zetaproteobacteria bacterium CG_4_9_14_3_um_filter_54_145]